MNVQKKRFLKGAIIGRLHAKGKQTTGRVASFQKLKIGSQLINYHCTICYNPKAI